ncbi:hypothetical protein ACFL20_07355 [Spirochaetota bacterium]
MNLKILFCFLITASLFINISCKNLIHDTRNMIINNKCSMSFWEKKFDANGGNDSIETIAIDSKDNVYVAGYGENLNNGTSGNDWWMKKFDCTGVEDMVNWNKTFKSFGTYDSIKSIAIDSYDNIYVGGNGYNIVDDSSRQDWWMKKFDSSGNELNFNGDSYPLCNNSTEPCSTNSLDVVYDGTSTISNREDLIEVISFDRTGSLYAVGYTKTGIGNADWWIKKFSPQGVEDTTNWNKIIPGPNLHDSALAIAFDSQNNVYVGGYSDGLVYSANKDAWIKKFDANGNELDFSSDYPSCGLSDPCTNSGTDLAWDADLAWGGSNFDAIYTIKIDSSDNIYIGSQTENHATSASSRDWRMRKFNVLGAELSFNGDNLSLCNNSINSCSTNNLDIVLDNNSGDEYLISSAIDFNGDIFFAGYGPNLASGTSNYDWWIKKFSSTGMEYDDWNIVIDGGGHDQLSSIATDSHGNLYVGGFGTNLIGPTSQRDWWIRKISSDSSYPE